MEPSELAAVVGREQPPLEAGGAARHPALPRLLAVAQASAAVVGLLDSPDKARRWATVPHKPSVSAVKSSMRPA